MRVIACEIRRERKLTRRERAIAHSIREAATTNNEKKNYCNHNNSKGKSSSIKVADVVEIHTQNKAQTWRPREQNREQSRESIPSRAIWYKLQGAIV